ncbi:Beta-glucosidase 12 [Turnera subulata]|uniref:Beta-glucosidase 12 n=1 Tax=Turnera subulata TaxID=218843 RepID=A0A9Q0F0L6_9ROSI|nr:Beta-glucosidase 12 [Turnera subulata]
MTCQSFVIFIVSSLLIVLGLVVVGCSAAVTPPTYDNSSFNRARFPQGFLFGTASSAYQYEGAAHSDGRGPSIWDTFTHRYPGRIQDRSNGDVAIDSYNRYKEDVAIMKHMGLDAYRFSISWSRILPNGKLSGGVNKLGITYYNNLINELLANGIQPFVTLFHWDLPQALEDEYGGFLSPKIVKDFQDYAGICFKEFGHRVKHWITLNEPSAYSKIGYATGKFAPGRCSQSQYPYCFGGDSATEPYIVTHYQLLAHAAAVNLYKQKYQAKQRGLIGITLVSDWFVPFSDAKHHQNAAARALDFMFGWYMDPITRGEYPHTMRSLVGNRLPKFTEKQSRELAESFDFIGLNYYTANYAAYMPSSNAVPSSYLTDARANISTERNGIPIGPRAASDWLHIYPRGIRDVLLYTKKKYNNPLIFITENGVDDFNNATLTLEEALSDRIRVDFYRQHLSFVHKAIKDGVNVKGYFAWSLLDNFEWASGYTVRFGLNYVDYSNGLKKHPKLSAHWFKSFLKK